MIYFYLNVIPLQSNLSTNTFLTFRTIQKKNKNKSIEVWAQLRFLIRKRRRSCSLLARKNGSSVFLSLSEGMRQQRRSNVWLCAILNSMPWPSAKETFLKKNGKNCVSSWQKSLKKRWTNTRLNNTLLFYLTLNEWLQLKYCSRFFVY